MFQGAKAPPNPMAAIDFGAYARKIVSFLARNFFTLKFIALAIAFTINFMLLFYRVSLRIQSCMSFTEKIVVAKNSAKVMHSIKVMQFIY